MSDEARFEIAYDGEALRSNSMDVRDLGPALMSLGQLFDEANRVLNDDKTSIHLKVVAQTPGSFEISLLLTTSIPQDITSFLAGDYVTSALNLKELILGGGVGIFSLFQLIRWLKGGKPTKIKDNGNGTFEITFEKETFIIPLKLLRLYQDIAIRRATESVLSPLKKEGIDTFKVKQKRKVIEVITKEDLHYFATPSLQDEQITETERISAFTIVSVTFKEDNKWRLSDGNVTMYVTIKDTEFLYKVENNLISFSYGDILRCRVRTVQWRTSEGLKTEHEVLEVLEHIKAARQLKLL